MATATAPTAPRTLTMADVLIDDLPPARILLNPTPGTATAADVVAIHDREDRLCELVDGILVEKTKGAKESILAMMLGHHLLAFVLPRQLGIVLGADGMIRFAPDRVRLPDVSLYLRDRLPDGKLPDEAISSLIPDLAVEILSPSNTVKEMDRKLRDYFAAGVRLVWYADPRKRTVLVYEGVDRVARLDATGILDGGVVLPGFALCVGDWLE